MDKKLRKILTECIRDIETGARDMEGCLERHPDRAAELRPHLELWSSLDAAPKARPNFAGQQRGQHKLQATLTDMKERQRRMIPTILAPAAARAAAVIAAVALLAGGAAGASAALGGPDVGGQVLSAMGINHAPDAAQTGEDHANPNAFEGSDNAGQGIGNASETGRDHANPNALDGPNNADDQDADAADQADDGLNTANEDAADDGLNTASDNAPDQADDGLNTAGDAGAPDDVPPDSPPVPDSVPDSAPIPDSLPVGP
ncbi:MAG: hypothetical protein Q8Q00_07845 [Dehalococcoidia bacterium]|nr:hypothetical protein [Dehalococcoidia bacterium]